MLASCFEAVQLKALNRVQSYTTVKDTLEAGAGDTKVGIVTVGLSDFDVTATYLEFTVTVKKDERDDQKVKLRMTDELKLEEGLMIGKTGKEFKDPAGNCFSGEVVGTDAELHWVSSTEPDCDKMNGANRVLVWQRLAKLMGADTIYLQDHAQKVCGPFGKVRMKPFEYATNGRTYYEGFGYVAHGEAGHFPKAVAGVDAKMKQSAKAVLEHKNPELTPVLDKKSVGRLKAGNKMMLIKGDEQIPVTVKTPSTRKSGYKIELTDEKGVDSKYEEDKVQLTHINLCAEKDECGPDRTVRECAKALSTILRSPDDCECAVMYSNLLTESSWYLNEPFDSVDVYKKKI